MFCKSGILIFIFAENNYFVRRDICPHHVDKNTFAPSELWSPYPSLSLSLSLCLFFRLIPWSAEALWVHFPARASKTLSRRRSAPSPHREGTWGLREQSKPCAGALLAFCANQGISASFSLLYFLIGWLQTTRFQSIKGPQEGMRRYLTCVSFSSYDLNFLWWFSGLNDFLRKVHSRVSGIKWVFGSIQLILLYSRYHIRWIGDTASVVHK